jgi:poly(3-hydroxyalkanoate) synthetase
MTERSSKPHPTDSCPEGHEPLREPTAAAKASAASFAAMPLLWPLYFANSMSDSTASILRWYSGILAGAKDAAEPPAEVHWETPNRVVLELPTMRLRDFSTAENGQSTLICPPYALHGSTISDFASRHSIVEALRQAGLCRVHLTDWLSAEPQMRFFSIDTYLADLNVAVDALRQPVDLIGLCQGGWMAVLFAARFPEKVRRLVVAGAPIDVRAARSDLMRTVDGLPFSAFENLVRLGEGRVLGRYALKLWGSASVVNEPERVLQLSSGTRDRQFEELRNRLVQWNAWTVDLPGTYYLQVVERIFKRNEIAEGRFVALGRTLDLATLDMPMYLLAAEDDEVVAPDQLFALARYATTPKGQIETETAACGHLGIFMGAETIAGPWSRIARWLSRDLDLALAS